MKKLLVLLALFAVGKVFADVQIGTEEYPPYNYTDKGKITGLAYEVVEATMKKSGIGYTIKSYPWARVYQEAQTKPNYGIFSMSRIEAREKLFKWVGEVGPTKYYFFALKSKNVKIANLEDAKKYKIGVVLKDIVEIYLKGKGFTKVESVNDHELNLKKLYAGNIDVLPISEAFAKYLFKKEGKNYADIEQVYPVEDLSKEGYYLAFSPQTPDDTVNKVKTALESIKKDGTFDKIVQKYK